MIIYSDLLCNTGEKISLCGSCNEPKGLGANRSMSFQKTPAADLRTPSNG